MTDIQTFLKNNPIFPIRVLCDDNGRVGPSYARAFVAIKPAGMSWYSFDMIIHSYSEVEFIVYDMRDTVTGGIGNVIATFKATVPPELIEGEIAQIIKNRAHDFRMQELANRETVVINRYVDLIRGLTEDRNLPKHQ